MTDKDTLRAAALARRDQLTTAEREQAAAAIAERAIVMAEDLRPAVIAAYMPIWSEADPGAIITWAHRSDVAVVLPAMVGERDLAFRLYRDGDELELHRFGTRAPPAAAPTRDPDLVIAPLVAFDRKGSRLGYGAGFYDRAIAALRAGGKRPRLLGLAFSVQEVASIPAEPHDAGMDWIVTERETIAVPGRK